MRLILVRHGQSQNNQVYAETGGDLGRYPDPKLTDLGRIQAERVAAALASDTVPWRGTHLYASLMLRALETAAPIAAALDLPITAHPELHEGGGPYTRDDRGAFRHHPGSPRQVLAAVSDRIVLPEVAGEDGWFAGPFEPFEAIAARAQRLVTELRDRHTQDDVPVLVTHGFFTQYLLRELLGIGEMSGWFEIKNTAITLLHDDAWVPVDAMPPSWVAERIGWMPHLTEAQVTT